VGCALVLRAKRPNDGPLALDPVSRPGHGHPAARTCTRSNRLNTPNTNGDADGDDDLVLHGDDPADH